MPATQWAKVIMAMERTAPPDKAKEYLEQYSLKLGDNLRGVMVIKAKDKTRASQRKGALANWKVVAATKKSPDVIKSCTFPFQK